MSKCVEVKMMFYGMHTKDNMRTHYLFTVADRNRKMLIWVNRSLTIWRVTIGRCSSKSDVSLCRILWKWKQMPNYLKIKFVTEKCSGGNKSSFELEALACIIQRMENKTRKEWKIMRFVLPSKAKIINNFCCTKCPKKERFCL